MAKGQYGSADVPKKAISAMEIVYQASKFRGVIGNIIPTESIADQTFKFDVTIGAEGEYNVQPDAATEHRRLEYTQLSANIVWSRYDFMVTDGSKLNNREPRKTWANAIRAATEYFAAVKDYQVINVLSSGAASNHTAVGGNWDTTGADIEEDLLTGLSYIDSNSNVQEGDKYTVIFPIDVKHQLKKLELIGNIQRQMGDYLEKSFDLTLRAFRPYKNSSGTAILDALEDDCVIFVNGDMTAKHAQFSSRAAASLDFPLTERYRVAGRGDGYYQRMGSIGRVVWDGVDSTNTNSNRIYKILDVT